MKTEKNIIVHRSEDRGFADHGWLKARHSFSFGGWYNPSKVHFGALRVLNDDHVAPKSGFPTHPHNNMEIITIPLDGSLEHKDNMGNSGTVRAGEIQVMSAGRGVTHSEFNVSETEDLKLFQIWIIPNKQAVTPRYAQMAIDEQDYENGFNQLVSPDAEDKGLWIHQNAWILLGKVEEGETITHQLKSAKNGIYVMVIDGEAEIEGTKLKKRDAVGVTGVEQLQIKGLSHSKVLLLDVPMNPAENA